jgi:enamidase
MGLVAGFSLISCAPTPEPLRSVDLVITNATVLTGTGEAVDGASIVVSGGRIETVSVDPIAVTSDLMLDLAGSGYTVLPGLVDTHIHLVPSSGATSDRTLAAYMETSLPGRLESFLAAGTTTVYDEGDYWPAIGEIRDRIASGELAGPRVFTVGLILTAPDGHPSSTICPTNTYCQENRLVELDTVEQARGSVDLLVEGGADSIKVVSEAYGIVMDRDILDAVIEQARMHGIPVDSHAETVESAIEAVEAGVTRLVHPPRFGDVEGTEFVQLVLDNGVTVAATVGFVGPGNADRSEEDLELYATLKQNVQALRAANVLLAFGTDNAGGPALPRVALEASALADIGLTPNEIITTMTRDSAIYIGQEDNFGTLEPGKLADILIVDGNPLDDLSALGNVILVIKDGQILIDNR